MACDVPFESPGKVSTELNLDTPFPTCSEPIEKSSDCKAIEKRSDRHDLVGYCIAGFLLSACGNATTADFAEHLNAAQETLPVENRQCFLRWSPLDHDDIWPYADS